MSRRAILAAAGAGMTAVLAGCAVYGAASAPPPRTAGETTGGAPSSGGASVTAQSGGTKPALAQASDIPVGGGKVLVDQQIVLTAPAAGTIKAFSAVCTHAGCVVANVSDGTINCICHGSKFNITDGGVANGPASSALPPVAIKVDGGAITLA
jgi:nitrite reductase/ring-hydroxylating ferredoxin subunit